MNVKFLGSTNKYIEREYKNMVGSFKISSGLAYIQSEIYSDDYFRTSLIDTMAQDGTSLTVKTLNSVYEFQILDGSVKDLDFSSLEKYRDNFEEFKVDFNIVTDQFCCQITGNSFIDNALSVCVLPKKMTTYEAREVCKGNPISDVNGDMVKNILGPYKKEN